MKRIVDGKTYNTDTATKVAGARIEGPDEDFTQQTLYVTRGGAFFIHEFERNFFFDQDADPPRWHQDAERFHPLSRDEAQEWFLEGDVEIFNNIFEEPPEASGDQTPEPEATIYVRVPEPLKRRISEAANEVNLSTNAWAMRCFEQCLGDVVESRTSASP